MQLNDGYSQSSVSTMQLNYGYSPKYSVIAMQLNDGTHNLLLVLCS